MRPSRRRATASATKRSCAPASPDPGQTRERAGSRRCLRRAGRRRPRCGSASPLGGWRAASDPETLLACSLHCRPRRAAARPWASGEREHGSRTTAADVSLLVPKSGDSRPGTTTVALPRSIEGAVWSERRQRSQFGQRASGEPGAGCPVGAAARTRKQWRRNPMTRLQWARAGRFSWRAKLPAEPGGPAAPELDGPVTASLREGRRTADSATPATADGLSADAVRGGSVRGPIDASGYLSTPRSSSTAAEIRMSFVARAIARVAARR